MSAPYSNPLPLHGLPHEIGLINSIEAVQRSFTKRISGLRDTSYADRLSLLGLQSLEHRRLISDLATCFIIVYGHCSLEFAQFFSHNPFSRCHSLLLSISLVKTNSAKYIRFFQSFCPTMEFPASWCSNHYRCQIFQTQLARLDLSEFLTLPTLLQS